MAVIGDPYAPSLRQDDHRHLLYQLLIVMVTQLIIFTYGILGLYEIYSHFVYYYLHILLYEIHFNIYS